MFFVNPTGKTSPNQSAAHEFLVELRTRVAIQPLPYGAGVEAAALKSLYELFGYAREAMKKYPGCSTFADEATRMLNEHVRPVTAKWHRAMEAGQLQSRDGSDEFRADLKALQPKLRAFASKLHQMAYGTAKDEFLTEPELDPGILKHLMQDVRYRVDPDTPRANEIETKEAEELAKRRRIARPGRPDTNLTTNVVGLALSGGGIRSATFCLGAIQVLADKALLKDVDFLSTVSGGGYTGSFLTSQLAASTAGSIDDNYRRIAGQPVGPDPAPIRRLRQHAKYLMTYGLMRQWIMAAGALAGLLLNWTVPVGAIAALALIVACGSGLVAPWIPAWATLLNCASVACLAALLVYAVALRFPRMQRSAGLLLASIVGLTVLMAAVWAVDAVHAGVLQSISAPGPLIGIAAIAAGAGPILVRFLPFLKKPIVRTTVLKVLLVLAGIVLPLAAIALFYFFLHLATADHALGLDWLSGKTFLLAIVAVCAVISFLLLNINRTAPYWLYRGFLSKTFVEGAGSVPKLSELNCAKGAPYHLVNAAVNLTSSEKETIRDRKTDFFLFSPHWCGSPTVGYSPTTDWKTDGAELDLSTAMAVSGAAFSTYMGLASMPALTAMLTFLNVRLGFWLRQPPTSGGRPGFVCLLREMTGLGMSETNAWLNISDGGHIENMGLYELLRRRCKFIICVDGEADPAFTFHGLMTLVRHAQIDFGIRIDPNLGDLRLAEETRFCKTHYVFCRIHYPGGAVGLLLYVKLSATGNESELIQRYRLTHPEFPHQSTLDQFFDEEQFEAYRQLGVHVMDGLFSPAMGTSGAGSIPDWFSGLAANLLEPLAEEAGHKERGRA